MLYSEKQIVLTKLFNIIIPKKKKFNNKKYMVFLQFNMTFCCITLLWWCIEKNEIKNPHLISIQLEQSIFI